MPRTLTQKLGRNQRTILELMARHNGVFPYVARHNEKLILRSLQQRGLVSEALDGMWHLNMGSYQTVVDHARLR